eukprot:CAMPEP_0171061144 /NCGR_PEP_ID=MMETSP0766_2-20121228/4248_1 /TAXON_ID=439317 /ORGANISM="Gambierdiscus australes, Strain CAWD 149" /LENGTH=262 /DNA_ID=CAMNT_0011516779 /DNA_START=64 /DNA_END=848 /DNA_ORIENTATION=-
MDGSRLAPVVMRQSAPATFSFPECLPLKLAVSQTSPAPPQASVSFAQLRRLQKSTEQAPQSSLRPMKLATAALKIHERFAGLLLLHPYNARSRVQSSWHRVLTDFDSSDGEGNRIFHLEGEESEVRQAQNMLEDMLLDLYGRHGMDKPGVERSDAPHTEPEEAEFQEIAVLVDGEEELVQVHATAGPLWLQLDGSSRQTPRMELGCRSVCETGAEWRGLGLTDKKVLLITAAAPPASDQGALVAPGWLAGLSNSHSPPTDDD